MDGDDESNSPGINAPSSNLMTTTFAPDQFMLSTYREPTSPNTISQNDEMLRAQLAHYPQTLKVDVFICKCRLCRKPVNGSTLTCAVCVNKGRFCHSKHDTCSSKRRQQLATFLNSRDYEEFRQFSLTYAIQTPAHLQSSDRMFLLKKFRVEKRLLQAEFQQKMEPILQLDQKRKEILAVKNRLKLIVESKKRLQEIIEKNTILINASKISIRTRKSHVLLLKRKINDINRLLGESLEKKREINDTRIEQENILHVMRRKRINEIQKYVFPIEQVSIVRENFVSTMRALSSAQQPITDGLNSDASENDELLRPDHSGYQIVQSHLPANGDYQIDKLLLTVDIDSSTGYGDLPQSSTSFELHDTLSALSHACQLVNVIAFYLHIALPFRLHQLDFNGENLTSDCIRANIAKLNANIVSSCISQDIPIDNANVNHTLENLSKLLTCRQYRGRPNPVIYSQPYLEAMEEEVNEISRTYVTDYWFYDVDKDVTDILNNDEWETISPETHIPDDPSIHERFNSTLPLYDQPHPSAVSNHIPLFKNVATSLINNIMPANLTSSHFLQEMAYPPYCIQPLKSWGMIAIGGGGGTAKTGVANAVDLKWIYLNQSSDPNNNKCTIQNVNSFTQHDSVMRMVSVRKQHEYLILALNRQLKVVMLKPSQREVDSTIMLNHLSSSPGHAHEVAPPVSMTRSLRRRHNSSTSTTDGVNIQHRPSIVLHRNGQATVEAVGNESIVVQSPTNRSNSFNLPAGTSVVTHNIYTVPIKEQEYVNALVVCPATQSKLFVGASDGSLTIYEIIWPATSSADRLIQLKLLTSFTAHKKEIDDLAVDPFGTWLISTSRDHYVQIRQCTSTFDKHSELDLCQFGMNKSSKPPKPLYRIRHVRFGIVPSSSSSSNVTYYLYTSLIPQAIVDKIASYIVQWTENKQKDFVVRQRRVVSQDRISATAVSNCGQFVATGDSGGFVRIYEYERLHLLYEHRTHSIFVTDLAFILRKENYLYETSVLSISADKNLYVHNVHPPQANIFSVSFLIVIGLLLLFFFLSQIRFRFH